MLRIAGGPIIITIGRTAVWTTWSRRRLRRRQKILRGPVPARQAATFASAAAALCATKIGGRAGVPTTKDVESFIKSKNT